MRIDIPSTIERIDFSAPVWEWIDLLGELLAITQEEAIKRDSFIAEDDFDKLMLAGINRQLRILNSIYVLIRFDYLDLAAAQVRMLCESLIVLSFVSKDKERYAKQFWDYYAIESFELGRALVDLEEDRANDQHIRAMEEWLEKQKFEYERIKPQYTQVISKGRNKGKNRNYINWCNKSVAQQASICGKQMDRLYKLVYKQMSAYIHCSALSLRHQLAYSSAHYDASVVHKDIATIVRTTVSVWEAMCQFLEENLDWQFGNAVVRIIDQVQLLDKQHFETGSRNV